MHRILHIVAVLAGLTSTHAFYATAIPRVTSYRVGLPSRLRRTSQAGVAMAMGSPDRESVAGVADILKRRGERLARELADAAERAGEVLDEGLDVLLGPRPAPAPALVPIPVPVDPPLIGGGSAWEARGGF